MGLGRARRLALVAAVLVAAGEDVAAAVDEIVTDRFGLGWRPELAAGILASLDRIDLVEVIADDFFSAPTRSLRALCTLARQVPVSLHGVQMGVASTVAVDQRRFDAMASLADEIGADSWSEPRAWRSQPRALRTSAACAMYGEPAGAG